MNNLEAINKVISVFEGVSKANSLNDLADIVENDALLNKNRMSESVYPDLKITLSPSDILYMKEKGVLDSKGMLEKR